MTTFLASAACARLPADALPRLARWRDRPGVRVIVEENHLWVFWPAGDEVIARHLLALPGAMLVHQRDAAWLRQGEHLPIFDVPDAKRAVTLDLVLAPAPLTRETTAPRPVLPLTVRLVRDETPRKATAIRLRLTALAAWADSALTDDLDALEAAIHEGEVIVRGRLPALAGERFWGRQLLIAAGWRPEPNLAEGILAEALGLGMDNCLFTPDGVEIVPGSAFGPVSRAGVRLAIASRGGQP